LLNSRARTSDLYLRRCRPSRPPGRGAPL